MGMPPEYDADDLAAGGLVRGLLVGLPLSTLLWAGLAGLFTWLLQGLGF